MADEQDNTKSARSVRGRMLVQGGQPISWVEDSEAVDTATEPPEELLQAASRVGDTLAAYVSAAKTLLKSKYSDLRDFAPSHLREPCDVTAICCRNGIVVRYDTGTEGATKVRSAALDTTLTDLAPKFSDSLIHFPVDRSSYDPGPGGITLQMAKVQMETGAKEEISTVRLLIFGSPDFPPGVVIAAPPSKPPCLMSCTNELAMVMGGFVMPMDPTATGNIERGREFVARGVIQLQVGWRAIEVYPQFNGDYWKPEFARQWAETDLLAAAARRQLTDNQFASLDPNVPARRVFKHALDELGSLLDGPEEPAHQFLKQHPEILCPTNIASWSKLPLGNRVTDFVFREPTNEYLLVEIESPLRELFRSDGQQREELTHAFNQIIDWRVFIEDNLRQVQDELGLVGISVNPRSLIVIGRSAKLSKDDRRKLITLENQIPRLRILTYDDLIQSSKAIAENLFGPLDIVGHNLEIYYSPAQPRPGG